MNLVVQKFGGTSVGNIDRIKGVARIIESEVKKGNKVVAVVSAMAGTTDSLANMASEFISSGIQDKREYDAVVATGEVISAGLLSLALNAIGIPAISLQAWQIPIKSCNNHSSASIESVNSEEILFFINQGKVPIICGFQGCHGNQITTLGRGGSDTTAVAVAAALGAVSCDIYTDVDGVYTADPTFVKKAHKIKEISYDHMLTMAYSGAKVLHPRSVELARKNGILIRVLSTFSPERGGTDVFDYKEKNMEQSKVIGISSLKNITYIKAKFECEAHTLFDTPILNDFNLEYISNDNNEILLTQINNPSIQNSQSLPQYITEIATYKNLAKLTLTGHILKGNQLILQKMFALLREHNINVIKLLTNDSSLVFFVQGNIQGALEALHREFIEEKA